MARSSCRTQREDSRWPHGLAVAICCVVFPLIWVGGLVTTYDAGMAVPDWPNTYGYNLFLYPWQTWLFGPFDLLIEHGHRLLGAAAGLLTIWFVRIVFAETTRWSRRAAALGLLGLVLAQGILGGMRVLFDERVLALLHACLGLGTFAYAAAMAVVTSRYVREPVTQAPGVLASGKRVLRLAVLTAVLVYLQVLLGALLRHVPVAASPAFFRIAVLFHVGLGLGVAAHGMLLVVRCWRLSRAVRRIRGIASVIGLLLVVQLGLGSATWVVKYGWPDWFAQAAFAASYTIQANSLTQAMVTTLHVAVGALVLAATVVLAVRSTVFFRLPQLNREPIANPPERISRRARSRDARRQAEWAT